MSYRMLIATTVARTLRGFLLPYARHFSGLGWTVDAAARGATGCCETKAAFRQVFDVPWSRRLMDPGNVRAGLLFRSIVAEGGYDLVHVHTPVAAFVARVALGVGGTPRPKVVYTAHGFHFHSGGERLPNAAFRVAERIAGRWTDELIVINAEDAEAARRFRIVPSDRITHMRGIGIDLSAYAPEKVDRNRIAAVRREAGIRDGAPVIAMVAEFIERKRHRDLLEAFARMTPSAVLVLVGDGPVREAAQARARALGVSDRVRFLGYRRDVPTILSAAAVSVLPSAQEGLPRVVMESMALGVPVVASDIRGNRDLLSGGAGLLFPIGDVRAMAEQISRVLSDPLLSGDLTVRALARIRDYELARVISDHELLYGRMLGGATA